MEPGSKRLMVSGDDAGVVLSPDVLWEVLLRVPAKPLCRFRSVCRSWRSLFSDPSFTKAHAALRPGLIVALAGDNDRIDMTDLSGNVVRRINIAPEDVGIPQSSHPGPFYLLLEGNRARVVDPDTGAVISTLPANHLQRSAGCRLDEPFYALGRVASTGQHKVLRVITRQYSPVDRHIEQHYDVFTLGGRCWRPVASAPFCVVEFHAARRLAFAHNAVIQGVVYFMPDDIVIDTNCVMAFDLETEEWRPETIPGPPAINTTDKYCQLKLAKLNGRLVMIRQFDNFQDVPTVEVEIDLWFATDLEKGVWVKGHTIRLELPVSENWFFAPDVHLLSVLDDGRVVFYYSAHNFSGNWVWRTRIYDSRTNSCTEVPQHGVRFISGMYRGSMLCLESQ